MISASPESKGKCWAEYFSGSEVGPVRVVCQINSFRSESDGYWIITMESGVSVRLPIAGTMIVDLRTAHAVQAII